jgi:hypothetical protein
VTKPQTAPSAAARQRQRRGDGDRVDADVVHRHDQGGNPATWLEQRQGGVGTGADGHR